MFKSLIKSISFLFPFLFPFFIYHQIYFDFFSFTHSFIGHDYSYHLSRLLAGYIWWKKNTYFDLPYFTPYLCGGGFLYANPQSLYLSLTQFFIFFLSPLKALYLSIIFFAFLGYLGTYILLRKVYKISQYVAVLGALLFLFNSFYTTRMIVGHITYHAFMLIPWVLFFFTYSKKKKNLDIHLLEVVKVLLASLCISYFLYSGAIHLLIPLLIILSFFFLLDCRKNYKSLFFWIRSLALGFLTLFLCAAKFSLIYSVLKKFPRNFYQYPGVENLLELLIAPVSALFVGLNNGQIIPELTHSIGIKVHEWDYYITPIPVVLLTLSLFFKKGKLKFKKNISFFNFSLLLILILPLLFNLYTPAWNLFLKKIPGIGNSVVPWRVFCAYIPLVIIFSCVCYEKNFSFKHKNKLTLLCIFLVPFFHLFNKKNFILYKKQNFNPIQVEKLYKEVSLDQASFRILANFNFGLKKDLFAIRYAVSNLTCYESLYGYRLQEKPGSFLVKGSIKQEIMIKGEKYYNFINPACLIYPKENFCDQKYPYFSLGNKRDLLDFTAYKKYSFQLPWWQKVFNRLSLTCFLLSVLFLLLFLSKKIFVLLRGRLL